MLAISSELIFPLSCSHHKIPVGWSANSINSLPPVRELVIAKRGDMALKFTINEPVLSRVRYYNMGVSNNLLMIR